MTSFCVHGWMVKMISVAWLPYVVVSKEVTTSDYIVKFQVHLKH